MKQADRLFSLEAAGWNVINLRSDEIALDLMTDVPQRPHQRYQLAEGDDRAGDHDQLCERAAAIFGPARYAFFQKGRGAERALAAALLPNRGRVLANGLFRTTALSLTSRGLTVENSPVVKRGSAEMDLEWLARELARGDVRAVYIEVANNSLAGWPLTADHAAEVRSTCDRHGTPLLLDLTRVLTNGLLVGDRGGVAHARDVAQHGHGFVASLAKEFSVPVGALVGVRDAELQQSIFVSGFEEGALLDPLSARCSLGLALEDVKGDLTRVRARASCIAELADLLTRAGAPIVRPEGGHAVFLDVSPEPATLPQCFAWMALLYLMGGIRGMLMPTSRLGGSMLRLALPVDASMDTERVANTVAQFLAHLDEAPSLLPLQERTLHPVYLQRFAREKT